MIRFGFHLKIKRVVIKKIIEKSALKIDVTET